MLNLKEFYPIQTLIQRGLLANWLALTGWPSGLHPPTPVHYLDEFAGATHRQQALKFYPEQEIRVAWAEIKP